MLTINSHIHVIRLTKFHRHTYLCIGETNNYIYNPIQHTLTLTNLTYTDFYELEHMEREKYLGRFTVKEYCGPDVVIK